MNPEMVWIPGGTFQMGSDHHYPEDAPARRVAVEGFWMDAHPVTNTEFHRFVAATRHTTVAERPPPVVDTPDADLTLLAPGSAVFTPPAQPVDPRGGDAWRTWWTWAPGANWRHPEGPESSFANRGDHPVVHVAWDDALAYATWSRRAPPSEAEWEFAARGGLDGAEFAWGDDWAPQGPPMANTWQGDFPIENLATDGWVRTSPAGAFPPNGYGLYDLIGNVWEWTSGSSTRLVVGSTTPTTVIKGGSFLCAPSYCQRYRPAARMEQALDSPTCHLGFRCISRTGPQ